MKLTLTTTTRLPKWPIWAITLVITWLLLILANTVLTKLKHIGAPKTLCLFKHITTMPCPTCGITRATIATWHGNYVAAFMFNPFMVLLCMIVILQLLLGICIKRKITLSTTTKERYILLSITALLFLCNWFYLFKQQY